MIPAIEIVGRVRITEETGQPQAHIAWVDGHYDVALVVDHVLQGGEWVPSLTEHRVIDQALLAPELQRSKGMRMQLPVAAWP